MLLDEFFNYKNHLMELFCSNNKILKLLTDDNSISAPCPKLAYDKIFPLEYIPDTLNQGGTYICYDVDILDVENETFLKPVLYIWIFTHKSKLRLPEGGLRLDELCTEINKELNGNRHFGLGKLALKRVERFVPIDEYQGRCLTYITRDFNNTLPHKKPPVYRGER